MLKVDKKKSPIALSILILFGFTTQAKQSKANLKKTAGYNLSSWSLRINDLKI